MRSVVVDAVEPSGRIVLVVAVSWLLVDKVDWPSDIVGLVLVVIKLV